MLKGLYKDSTLNFMGHIVPAVVTILSLPYIIEKGGKETFTYISLFLTIVVISSIADFGVGKAYIKVLGENKERNTNKNKIYSAALLCSLVISIAGIGIIFFVSRLVEFQDSNYKILINLTLWIFPVIIFINLFRSVLESDNRFFEINLLRIFANTLSVIFPLIVISYTNNIYYILFSILIIKIIHLIIIFILSYRKDTKMELDIKILKSIIKLSFNLGLINIFGTLVGYLDRIIPPIFLSAIVLSDYLISIEIASKLWMLTGAIFGAAFPKLVKDVDKYWNKKTVLYFNKNISYILFLCVLVVNFLMENILIVWLGDNYSDNIIIYIKLLLVGIIINCFNQINSNLLIIKGKEFILTRIQVILFFIQIAFMSLLTINFGLIGTCLAFSIRLIIDFCLVIIYLKKKINYNYINEILFVTSTCLVFFISEIDILKSTQMSMLIFILSLILFAINLFLFKWKTIQ